MNSTKNTFLIILGTFLLGTTQCARERTVTLNTIRPADIEIPSHINRLVIVDRTKFDKKVIHILEGILTGELPGEDKASMQFLTNGMRSELAFSPRFTIRLATETLNGNSLTSSFPVVLEWDLVQNLCAKYNADAMIAIEIFDSDFIITNGVRKKTVKEGNVARQVDEFYAQGINNLKIGLRLYHPQNKEIIDQQLLNKRGTWSAAANSKTGALLALIDKAAATRELSARIGADYAYRISPMTVRLTRSFRGKYRKAPALERGSRLADVGQWQEAIDVWTTGMNKATEKGQRYLCYNVAVAHEILGNMTEAREWASRSYTHYGNKEGKIYLRQLDRRIANEQIAHRQLNQ